jgi:alkyldihydroxyacetonephosphate synthase
VPNRGAPTPPIALPDGPVTPRLAPAAAVDVSDTLLKQLANACAEVVTDDAARAEAGRDWWPLAMTWALQGQVPATAGAIARPTSTAAFPSPPRPAAAVCAAPACPCSAASCST